MTAHRPANWTGPWGPGVTAYEATTSVVALHIAHALLNGKSNEVRTWARELAAELKREGIDLRTEIGHNLLRIALDTPSDEPPF
ncbi:hypothetical protein [Streptomyces sp. NPDC056387]|uniref:hypothetical protein n=1 Tax=Streptomyces sp. NPDC056387 TaxID=3345803 RepID=UPI0035D95F34